MCIVQLLNNNNKTIAFAIILLNYPKTLIICVLVSVVIDLQIPYFLKLLLKIITIKNAEILIKFYFLNITIKQIPKK